MLMLAGAQAQTSAPFGTFTKPFKADSPWNIRPVGPVFGPGNVLPAACGPVIGPNAEYGPPVFQAGTNDPSVVVYNQVTQSGIRDLDAAADIPSVTIPHFPATVLPAYGGDGHADIVDAVTGIIHSFWQLKKDANGVWRARSYAWSRIDGRGWGDPSHFYQGSRAVGIPPMAGIIRSHEVNDGEDMYYHALAMSLSKEGLAGKGGKPTYIYPATHADANSATNHTGTVPEGALMMLPPDYVMGIQNDKLKKVVETLKTYGARVVDENDCTPYFIYVETGAEFDLFANATQNSQQQEIRNELDKIRQNLRQVVSAYSYTDGNSQPTTADQPGNFNLLSMRGPWGIYQGPGPAVQFNGQTQTLEFPSSPNVTEQSNGNGTGVSASLPGEGTITWAKPVPGATYRFTVIGTGDASLRFAIFSGKTVIGTAPLTNGQSATLVWPASGGYMAIYAKNAANKAGSVRATMIRE